MESHQKINVCHLISGDLWAGAEVQVHNLLTALKSEPGLNVSAITLNRGKLADKLSGAGIQVTVVDESRNSFLRLLRLITNQLVDKEIDILHTHRYKENIIGALVKPKCKIKYLVQTVHGIAEPFRGLSGLKMGLYSRLNEYFRRKHFDVVLTVSDDIKHKLRLNTERPKIVTVHNAVDTALIKSRKTQAQVKKSLNIDVDRPVIGSAGRIVPVKGFEVFLEAARIVLKEKPLVRFVLAGDGPSRPKLQSLARKLGIEREFMFLGFREDIIDIINCLDIFVLPSYHEGIPMALLEAMALGKAVVATNVGGIKEIIEDNVSGLLVGSGDPRALALGCCKALDYPGLEARLGKAATKRVETRFSIPLQRVQVLALYREVTGHG